MARRKKGKTIWYLMRIVNSLGAGEVIPGNFDSRAEAIKARDAIRRPGEEIFIEEEYRRPHPLQHK